MIKYLLVLVIKAYQSLVSPFMPRRCRFYPTCSQYALESLQEFGLVKGMYMTVKRLIKCHPLNPGGFDPVIKEK